MEDNLQYCDGFCHTWIGHRCICVPLFWSPLPLPSSPHPSQLSQSTSFGCPASRIKLALAIYFTYCNVFVSLLFSQITPSLLMPLSTITNLKIETVIKNLLINKSPGPDGFTGEFYKNVREDLTPILLKLFQKIAEERKLPNSLYKNTIFLIPKSDKDATKKRKL